MGWSGACPQVGEPPHCPPQPALWLSGAPHPLGKPQGGAGLGQSHSCWSSRCPHLGACPSLLSWTFLQDRPLAQLCTQSLARSHRGPGFQGDFAKVMSAWACRAFGDDCSGSFCSSRFFRRVEGQPPPQLSCLLKDRVCISPSPVRGLSGERGHC